MSKEWMLKTLTNLGFTETDSQVYVYLATEGPRKASDIAEALKLTKQRIYERLRDLQNKGTVQHTNDLPTRFTATPLAAVLESYLRAKTIEAQHIERNKEEILAAWQTMVKKENKQ